MYKLILIISILSAFACNSQSEGVHIVSPTQANSVFQKKGTFQLVDVRTAEEYSSGHILNSKNICSTDEDFEENVKTLDKNVPIYVYCKKGGRSSKAAAKLSALGFKEIYDIEGGITAWENEKLPITKN